MLAHEHLRFRDEAVAEEWPSRYDEQLELDAALLAVNDAKDQGREDDRRADGDVRRTRRRAS